MLLHARLSHTVVAIVEPFDMISRAAPATQRRKTNMRPMFIVLALLTVHAVPQANAQQPESVERSESGAMIYRHKAREREFALPEHSAEHLAEIEAHVEKHVGTIETVFHEILSDLVHLDVLFVPATEARPFHVLVTSGVGDEPMKVPEGLEQFNRVELLIALPADWPLTEESFKDEANYWPIRWLKSVGRIPHEYETWLGWGHTIPNGDPAEPIADTRFIGVMLTPPYELPTDFFQLETKSGETITFFVMMPLYQEEMDLKLEQGAEEIEARLEKAGIGFVLDTARPNVALERARPQSR